MSAQVLALSFQLLVLNTQDQFAYTEPNIGKTFTYDGQAYQAQESNPISAAFLDGGAGTLYFVGAAGADVVAASLLTDFDKEHLKGLPIGTADIYMAAATLIEIDAIHSWAKFGFGPPEVSWTVFDLPVSI